MERSIKISLKPIRRCWLAALWLAALCLFGPGSAHALELTQQERDWIAQHGPVRVVVGSAALPSEPLYYLDSVPGRPGQDVRRSGYGIEAMQLLAERAGFRIQYVPVDSVREGLGLLISGHADMTPILRSSPQRQKFASMPGVWLPVEVVWVTRPDVGPITATSGFEGLRLAVMAGSVADEALTRDYPAAHVERLPTILEAARAVSEGRADAFLSENYSAIYTIRAHRLPGLQVRRVQGQASDVYGPLVSLRQPLLHGILAKAMATITEAERAQLARRWLPDGAGTNYGSQTAPLSDSDRAWVKDHGDVRAGFDPHLPPLTASSPLDGFEGLGADVLRAAAAKVGLRVVQQVPTSPGQMIEKLRSGAVNVMVGLPRLADSNQEFFFIGPWSQSPSVVVMRTNDERQAIDPADLPEGYWALQRGQPIRTQLAARLPGLQLAEHDTMQQVLQALADGQADAAIGSAEIVSRLVSERFAGRLRVTGVVPDGDSVMYFAVPRSQPELARILGLGFEALTPSDMAELRQRWLLVRVQPGLQWAEVLRWGLPLLVAAAVVVTVLLVANRRLRWARAEADRSRAAAEAATAARGRFLTYLAHEVMGLVNSIGWGARMMLDKEPKASADQISGWIRAAADQTGTLLGNTLENERAVTQGVAIHPQVHDLAVWWQTTLAPHQLLAHKRGLRLLDHPPQPSARLVFDGIRLAQVMNNLVGNAIKFTERGDVTVTGVWQADKDLLELTVQDTGPGIAPAELAQLWEPYAQGEAGRKAGQGAGLGLAISLTIVKAMGGSIEVVGAQPAVTCFQIRVPVQKAPEDGSARRLAPGANPLVLTQIDHEQP